MLLQKIYFLLDTTFFSITKKPFNKIIYGFTSYYLLDLLSFIITLDYDTAKFGTYNTIIFASILHKHHYNCSKQFLFLKVKKYCDNS